MHFYNDSISVVYVRLCSCISSILNCAQYIYTYNPFTPTVKPQVTQSLLTFDSMSRPQSVILENLTIFGLGTLRNERVNTFIIIGITITIRIKIVSMSLALACSLGSSIANGTSSFLTGGSQLVGSLLTKTVSSLQSFL